MCRDWIKKLCAGLFFLSLLLILTGCSSSGSQDGGMTYTEFSEEAADGIYVLKRENEKFYPLVKPGSMKNGGELKDYLSGSGSTYLMVEEDYESIPEVGPDDALVIKSKNQVDSPLPIYELEDYGWTFGMKVACMDVDGSSYTFSSAEKLTSGSDAAEKLSGYYSNLKNIRIHSVGTMNLADNMVSEICTINELERNELYEIVMYQGTSLVKEKVRADTIAFSSAKNRMFVLSDVLYTRYGYAMYQFPESVGNGYYVIEGEGIFRYSAA